VTASGTLRQGVIPFAVRLAFGGEWSDPSYWSKKNGASCQEFKFSAVSWGTRSRRKKNGTGDRKLTIGYPQPTAAQISRFWGGGLTSNLPSAKSRKEKQKGLGVNKEKTYNISIRK